MQATSTPPFCPTCLRLDRRSHHTLQRFELCSCAGDIDPAILTYLLGKGFTAAQLDELMNKQSGFLGMAGARQSWSCNCLCTKSGWHCCEEQAERLPGAGRWEARAALTPTTAHAQIPLALPSLVNR